MVDREQIEGRDQRNGCVVGSIQGGSVEKEIEREGKGFLKDKGVTK